MKKLEPIIMAVALGLLALGAVGLALTFPSMQDITGVSSTPGKVNNPAKIKPEEIQANLAVWNKPTDWKLPENKHRLFLSDGYLFYASAYPDGKYIQKNDGSARSPGGVLISWYQKYDIDFTNAGVDRMDSDGDGFSNITEFENGAATAAECDGTKSTNPLDSQSHPDMFSRLRLQKYDSRPFHIQFRGYQQIDGTYEFQIYLKDVPSYSQPRLLKTGDSLGFEGYKVGAFIPKMVDEKDPSTGITSPTDESTLELDKPDIGFQIILPYRKEIDSPESTADFVMLLPGQMDKTVKVERGKTFSIPELAPASYQMIEVKDTGATIREVASKQVLQVPKVVPTEWNDVPLSNASKTP